MSISLDDINIEDIDLEKCEKALEWLKKQPKVNQKNVQDMLNYCIRGGKPPQCADTVELESIVSARIVYYLKLMSYDNMDNSSLETAVRMYLGACIDSVQGIYGAVHAVDDDGNDFEVLSGKYMN